jgi:hypothetical protein
VSVRLADTALAVAAKSHSFTGRACLAVPLTPAALIYGSAERRRGSRRSPLRCLTRRIRRRLASSPINVVVGLPRVESPSVTPTQ